MKTLRLASCMAENTEAVCRAIAEYIQLKLDISTEYVTGIPWQEREALFDGGEIHILWLCGLPYVHKADLAETSMELLAVPIPAGKRYHGQPVYFSDVVVRRDSPVKSFPDLRGASWAYNEARSHSGYNVVRAHLFELGESANFFGNVVEAGAHSNSLQMILTGAVDGAAIDSTVLEWLGRQREGLAEIGRAHV
jgi:phosphonate transport system substrate-binding protein